MRKKIVAANWKMNMTQAEAARFVEALLLEIGDMRRRRSRDRPAVHRHRQSDRGAGQRAEHQGRRAEHALGTQRRLHRRDLRGDAARSVRALRRARSQRAAALFGETDEIVNRKVRAAHEATLAADRLRRRNARAARRGQGRKSSRTQLRGSLAESRRERIAGNRHRLRAGLGDRHRTKRHARAGAGSARFYPHDAARNVRRSDGRARSAFNTAAA